MKAELDARSFVRSLLECVEHRRHFVCEFDYVRLFRFSRRSAELLISVRRGKF